MPSRRKVEALKQLCIYTAIKNIPKYPTHWLHGLPTDFLEELIVFPNNPDQELVRNEQSLFISHFNRRRMIREHLTRLKLNFDWKWTPNYNNDMLNAALKTSTSLTHLTCEKIQNVSYDDFLCLIYSIPNIIELKIGHDNSINDEFLGVIGDCCPKLESLSLSSFSITDDGIAQLCQSNSGGCNIKYLELKYTKISHDGYFIAVEKMKQLRVFNNNNSWVVSGLLKMFEDFKQSLPLPTFQLCNLQEFRMIPSGFLNFLTKCSPNITCLSLNCSERLVDCVTELKKCDKIPPLKLRIMRKCSISDLGDLGSKLTGLYLDFTAIDLKLMAYTCPNLTELTLVSVSYLPMSQLVESGGQIAFSKLLRLNLVSTKFKIHGYIPLPHFNFLLGNCFNLEELKVNGYDFITDRLMIRTLHRLNPLRHLTRFTVRFCSKVSQMTIMELLMMENNLQFIGVDCCRGINADDKAAIKDYIKENNLQVQVA